MVKFAMLYFLESVLLGKEPKNKIDDLHIHLLDNFKEFNNYPWGRSSFEATILSLKNTITRRSKRIGSFDPNIEEKYSLYSFPFAFQVRILIYLFYNKYMIFLYNKYLNSTKTPFTVFIHASDNK